MNIRWRLALGATTAWCATGTAAHAQSAGGAAAPGPVAVSSVVCMPSDTCRRGGQLVISGSGLAETPRVVFKGGSSKSDDVVTKPSRTSDAQLSVTIPSKARSGPVWVQGVMSKRYAKTPSIRIAAAVANAETARLAGKAFLDGTPVSYRYSARAGQVVQLVTLADGAVRREWPAQVDQAGEGRVSWDTTLGGQDAPLGLYELRVVNAGSAPTARAASDAPAKRFELLDHIFPIRGKHDLGQSTTNGFGGGRGHQGQDMFAACGTRVVAARGGVVTEAKYDDRGGNFAVITDDTGQSNVYMHMRDPALVTKGQRVRTGTPLGHVGDTGRADGCHLHFEIWTAPGWYQGGEPIDALPELRRWDEQT